MYNLINYSIFREEMTKLAASGAFFYQSILKLHFKSRKIIRKVFYSLPLLLKNLQLLQLF